MKIEVSVSGRPPRKNSRGSFWAKNNALRVLNLRKAVYDVMKDQKITKDTEELIRMMLVVSAKNPYDESDKQTYVGDLDTFVAGISDTLQSNIQYCTKNDPACKKGSPGHERCAAISPLFDKHPRLRPSRPFLIKNDSQIAEISASKRRGDDDLYHLVIETLK